MHTEKPITDNCQRQEHARGEKKDKMNQNEMRQEEKMTMISSEEQERGPG